MALATMSRNGSTNGHAIPQGTINRVKMTPTMAKQLLSRNKRNRSLRKKKVAEYANAMKSGEWKYNGESIKVCTDGSLLDGQHRLEACIESGVTFDTLLVTNLPASVFSCIDVGRKRTGGDVLEVSGFSYSNIMASAIVNLTSISLGYGVYTGGPRAVMSNATMVELAGKYDGLEDACAFAAAHYVRGMAPPALIAALLYLYRQVDAKKADEFVMRLKDGIGLTKGCPIRLLRERLIGNISSKSKLSRRIIGALTIKAWNAYMAGKAVSQLKYASDEAFPEVGK